jgi:hypothetical protein
MMATRDKRDAGVEIKAFTAKKNWWDRTVWLMQRFILMYNLNFNIYPFAK